MRMYIKHFVFNILFIGVSMLSIGQETEEYLHSNSQQGEWYQQEKSYPVLKNKKLLTQELPFMDDFSRFSLPTNNPNIPTEWQRWEDNDVFINSTFPIQPPTIGVATFDGLDETGFPYNFTATGNDHLPSDTLTSLPINLEGLNQNDNVYLTFYYQAKGLGNSPELEDSLKLEFKIGEDNWVTKWVTPGINTNTTTPFQQVFIEVWDDQYGIFYMQNNFQFRFIGYSEQRGNLDHWHLDYVYMDQNIDPETFFFNELAIMNPKNTLLNSELTSMPWKHFKDNPSARMLNATTTLHERNLKFTDFNFRSGYKVRYENTEWDFLNVNSNLNNNVGIIETAISINTGDNSFVFDTDVNDTCAAFEVIFYHEFKDNITPQNDSTIFIQNFSNYYSYDDGTAEKAWALNNSPGGQVAVKFDSFIPDTLLGIWVYFSPFQSSSASESFILRAWDDDNSNPGNELGENFSFNYPEYHTSGHNKFTYYAYDSPIPVSGNFYVGWVQQENEQIKVGLDKNTNVNPVATFTSNGGAFPTWNSSIIEGSLMIRPVLKAGKDFIPPVGISEINSKELNGEIYPNPVNDILHLSTNNYNQGEVRLSILDITGKVKHTAFINTNQIDINTSNLEKGLYFIQISDKNGRSWQQKFIKSN